MRSARGAGRSALVLGIVVLLAVVTPGSLGAAPLNVDVVGGYGVVRATDAALSCADDGEGSYRHYFAEAPLAAGALSKLAGVVRSTFDVHYDGAAALASQPSAFLLGSESHVTLSNQRGSVQILLRRGTCQEPGVSFDGVTAGVAFPAGSWSSGAGDVVGTGAYRQATGSGTFGFSADMNPGADNAWALRLSGALEVLQPELRVKVERTFWGNLGLDYVARVVSVVYRVGNVGTGDAFNVRLKHAGSPTSGVTGCGEPAKPLQACPPGPPPQQVLGDLQACPDANLPATCDTELVTVRYKLGLVQPCALVVLNCAFKTTLTVEMPDSLDVSTDKSATVDAKAPALPPPL